MAVTMEKMSVITEPVLTCAIGRSAVPPMIRQIATAGFANRK